MTHANRPDERAFLSDAPSDRLWEQWDEMHQEQERGKGSVWNFVLIVGGAFAFACMIAVAMTGATL